MARSKTAGKPKDETMPVKKANPFQLRPDSQPQPEAKKQVHLLKPGIICDTEARGEKTPGGLKLTEIVVDSSEGFIPLWAKNSTLHWRFRKRSFNRFADPQAAKEEVRNLLGEALMAWDFAVPVKFKEDKDVWDFEIIVRAGDECSIDGCVLASAFFPDPGRNKLTIYPKMFSQSREEQVETLIHEIGHIFGLRHFFALVEETAWPAEIFGVHSKFSIMNYGNLSKLTNNDKTDLRRLYDLAWSGALTEINGTPIRLVKPFNTLARSLDEAVAMAPAASIVVPGGGAYRTSYIR